MQTYKTIEKEVKNISKLLANQPNDSTPRTKQNTFSARAKSTQPIWENVYENVFQSGHHPAGVY